MPLHDWASVPDRVFHTFHQAWLVFLVKALNGGILPAGYLARNEADIRPRRHRRVAVFSSDSERRVALVEVVSPGNKESRQRAAAFRAKLVECTEAGLHLLLVDVLPSPRTVGSLAAEISRELGAIQTLDPSERAATAFESQADPWEIRVYHQPLALDAPLPPVRLFLEAGLAVQTPLEKTYLEAVETLGSPDRLRLCR